MSHVHVAVRVVTPYACWLEWKVGILTPFASTNAETAASTGHRTAHTRLGTLETRCHSVPLVVGVMVGWMDTNTRIRRISKCVLRYVARRVRWHNRATPPAQR